MSNRDDINERLESKLISTPNSFDPLGLADKHYESDPVVESLATGSQDFKDYMDI